MATSIINTVRSSQHNCVLLCALGLQWHRESNFRANVVVVRPLYRCVTLKSKITGTPTFLIIFLNRTNVNSKETLDNFFNTSFYTQLRNWQRQRIESLMLV